MFNVKVGGLKIHYSRNYDIFDYMIYGDVHDTFICIYR